MHTYMYTYMYIYIHIYINTYACMYVCIWVCILSRTLFISCVRILSLSPPRTQHTHTHTHRDRHAKTRIDTHILHAIIDTHIHMPRHAHTICTHRHTITSLICTLYPGLPTVCVCVCMFVWLCVVLCVCVGAVLLMVVCAFAGVSLCFVLVISFHHVRAFSLLRRCLVLRLHQICMCICI